MASSRLLTSDTATVTPEQDYVVTPFVGFQRSSMSSPSAVTGNPISAADQKHAYRTSIQENLRRRHEIEAQLSSMGDTESASVVVELRRELEMMKARITELETAGIDGLPPSYVSEVVASPI